MLEYELKQIVNNDIELCKTEWENYSFDWERMRRLFDTMVHKYGSTIRDFDNGLNIISGEGDKNALGDTYRANVSIIIKRLEAFKANSYKNEGLYNQELNEYNIFRYDRSNFDEVRMFLDMVEGLNDKDKIEISENLDEIEAICISDKSPLDKWEELRPYVIWISGKNLMLASHVMPLMMLIR